MVGFLEALGTGNALLLYRMGVQWCFNGKRLRAGRMFEVMFAVVVL